MSNKDMPREIWAEPEDPLFNIMEPPSWREKRESFVFPEEAESYTKTSLVEPLVWALETIETAAEYNYAGASEDILKIALKALAQYRGEE